MPASLAAVHNAPSPVVVLCALFPLFRPRTLWLPRTLLIASAPAHGDGGDVPPTQDDHEDAQMLGVSVSEPSETLVIPDSPAPQETSPVQDAQNSVQLLVVLSVEPSEATPTAVVEELPNATGESQCASIAAAEGIVEDPSLDMEDDQPSGPSDAPPADESVVTPALADDTAS